MVRSAGIGRAAGWQGKGEDAAAPGFLLRRQLATMRFDNRTRNRQAQSHAIVLVRDEWLEQPAGNIIVNSGSDIANRNFDHAVAENSGCQGDFAPFLIRHGIKRVADEIDENLLDLNPVHEYVRGLIIKVEREARREWSSAAQCQGSRFLNHRRM